MGRIREYIDINGLACWTLFDAGARNTYITADVARRLTRSKLAKPLRWKLGGSTRVAKQIALVEAKIHGHAISTHAMVIDKIGPDEDGKPIEVLVGALAMQQWGIRPVPDQEKLDMTHYPHVFVEF
jgi:hypothetical protein